MLCNWNVVASAPTSFTRLERELSFVYEVCKIKWITDTCNRKSILTSTPRNTFVAFTGKVSSSLYKLWVKHTVQLKFVSQLVPQGQFLALHYYIVNFCGGGVTVLPSPCYRVHPFTHWPVWVADQLLPRRFLQIRPCMVRDQFESGWEEGQLGTVKAPVVKLTWEQVFILRTSIIRAVKEWKSVRGRSNI